MPRVDLEHPEIETLLDPWRETRALDLDDVSYSALRKLQDASGDEELSEERHGPLPRVVGDPDIWFLDLMHEEELDIDPEMPLQAMVVQHCQNAMSKLNESMRHAHDGNRQRVLRDAAFLGLFAMEIARRITDSAEWPPPRPE